MPVTPLHAGFVWPLKVLFKKRLDFIVLTVGAMLPDLELPVFYILTGGEYSRLILHSFAGGILIGIPLALLISYLFFSFVPVKFLKEKFNLNYEFLKPQNPLFSKTAFLSAFIGVMSHVIADVFMRHGSEISPWFWPFSDEKVLILLFNDAFLSALFTALIALVLIVLSAISFIKNPELVK